MNPALSAAGPFVAPENGNGKSHRGFFCIEEEAMRRMAQINNPAQYRKAVGCYVTLARVANLEGCDEFIRPIRSIASDCGYSYTETTAGLRSLQEIGLCEIIERKENGSKTSLPSMYRLKRVSSDFRSPYNGNQGTHNGKQARLRVIQPSSPGPRNFQESPRVPKNCTQEPTKHSSKQTPQPPKGGGAMADDKVIEEIYRLYPRKTKDRIKALLATWGRQCVHRKP